MRLAKKFAFKILDYKWVDIRTFLGYPEAKPGDKITYFMGGGGYVKYLDINIKTEVVNKTTMIPKLGNSQFYFQNALVYLDHDWFVNIAKVYAKENKHMSSGKQMCRDEKYPEGITNGAQW